MPSLTGLRLDGVSSWLGNSRTSEIPGLNVQLNGAIWVCLKMSCTPKPNGFADHDPYEKWLFHWEYTLFSDKPIWMFFFFPWHWLITIGYIAIFGEHSSLEKKTRSDQVWQSQKELEKHMFHRIGWWENLQESPIFDGKNPWVSCRFSLKPTQWMFFYIST